MTMVRIEAPAKPLVLINVTKELYGFRKMWVQGRLYPHLTCLQHFTPLSSSVISFSTRPPLSSSFRSKHLHLTPIQHKPPSSIESLGLKRGCVHLLLAVARRICCHSPQYLRRTSNNVSRTLFLFAGDSFSHLKSPVTGLRLPVLAVMLHHDHDRPKVDKYRVPRPHPPWRSGRGAVPGLGLGGRDEVVTPQDGLAASEERATLTLRRVGCGQTLQWKLRRSCVPTFESYEALYFQFY